MSKCQISPLSVAIGLAIALPAAAALPLNHLTGSGTTSSVRHLVGNIAKPPPAGELAGKLSQVVSDAWKTDDVQKVELGSPLRHNRGSVRVHGGGSSVELVCGRKDRQLSLKFVLVEPKDASVKPFYLSTTEVPVGFFNEALEEAGRWPEMKEILTAEEPGRTGPCTWDWLGDGSRITQSREWFPSFFDPEVDKDKLISPELGAGRPSRMHPMQYLSPDAALYFAGLLGCRLPTAAEWTAARQACDSAGTTWNLRDETWLRQKDHIYDQFESRGLRPPPYPDEGVFWPKRIPRKERLIGKKAVARDLSYNDGVLWFAKVDQGGEEVFRHLVGNVAEYVYEDPSGFEGQFANPEDLSAERVREFVAHNSSRIRAIGGSALSPWEAGVDKSEEVDLDDSRGGYSDVGFRLAFSAPTKPPKMRLVRAPQSARYLGNSSSSSTTD